jgi:hypothetical protein
LHGATKDVIHKACHGSGNTSIKCPFHIILTVRYVQLYPILGNAKSNNSNLAVFSIKNEKFCLSAARLAPPGSCLSKISKHARTFRQGNPEVQFRLKCTASFGRVGKGRVDIKFNLETEN